MEVNIVDELVLGVVFQGEFDVIILVNDNHRTRYMAIERKCPHEHARLDLDFFFLDGHFHFDDAWFSRCFEGVLWYARRGNELLFDAFQLVEAFGLYADFIAF